MGKLIDYRDLLNWRLQYGTIPGTDEHSQRKLTVTNGCFDVLHYGHLRLLQTASLYADDLLIGINSDAGVRALKGPHRPLHPENERAEILAELNCVTHVCIFPGDRATEFLRRSRPHVYVKGGDYSIGTLYPPELRALEEADSEIIFVPTIPNRSTSRILNELAHR